MILSDADTKPQGNVLISDYGHAMLTDFGRAKVLGELGFNTKTVAGSSAYMAPELTPGGDDNVNVDKMFSKESDVYAYAMLCQKVRIQLILNIEKFSRDSRYLLEKSLSLGITHKTIHKSPSLFGNIKGQSAQIRYPKCCGISWKVVGLFRQRRGLRLRRYSSSWVSDGYNIFFSLFHFRGISSVPRHEEF